MVDTRSQSRRRAKGGTTPNLQEADRAQKIADGNKTDKARSRCIPIIGLQIFLLIILVFIMYLVLAPSPIDPQPIELQHPLPRLDGVMKPNTKLQEAVHMFERKVSGPESLAQDKQGNLYTGLTDGRIVKITKDGKLLNITRTGKDLPFCGVEAEPECGRPLGLRFDQSKDNLIVADSFLGLLKVNIKSGKVQTLISAKEGMDGLPLKFLNDLVIASNGVIYVVQSSWKWDETGAGFLVLERGGHGRLMSFNPKTREKEVLLTGLYFGNGIELSENEDHVLVCETTMARIIKYYVKGPKKGTHETFAENLPGLPDNIRKAKGGGYWLATGGIRKAPFSFIDFIGPYPFIRNAIAKLLSPATIKKFVPNYGLVLKLDNDGKIIQSLHDPDGSVIPNNSEILEDHEEGLLYIGSYGSPFIGKLKL